MRVLICLTYYRPHISGLTIYVERLARGLARRGHSVTVLTSHFAPDLPYDEMLDGVRVLRLPVAFKFSKGVIQPGITLRALAQMLRHDVVSIHLPQAEAGALAFLSRVVARKPTVLTYHCDLQLPSGFLNRVIDRLVYLTNQIGISFAHRVVAYTRDYAINSPLLSKFLDKLRVIYPPVELPAPDARAVAAYHERFGLNGHRVVGFAARFAEEKGIQYLMQAVPRVLQKIPNVKFLLAGENRQVIGENVWARIGSQIETYRDHVHVLGTVPSAEMGNFFGACDVLTVPSINSTESFGLVQVEAMLSGCPVVASNLPGVREPVRLTRMGEIVPIKDAGALADAIVQVLANKENYVRPRAEIAQTFSIERTLDEYEKLFAELMPRRAR